MNAAAQVAAFCGILLIQTAYLVALARILGPEDFGTYSFLFSITQILLVGGDLGLHNTALRRISVQPESGSRTFAVFFSLKLILSSLLLLGVLVLAPWLSELEQDRTCLVFLGLGMFFHLIGLSLNITFQAHGKLYLASINSLLLVFLHVSFGLLGIRFGGRLVWLGLSYMSAAILALIVNWQVFRRWIHPVTLSIPTGWKGFFKESLPVGLGTLFENVALRVSFSMLSLMADSYHTGLFSAAHRITSAARNLPAGIFSAVLPVMAGLQGRPEQLARIFKKALGVTVLLAIPAASLLLLFSDPLVMLLFGPGYASSVPILRILAWAVLPTFLSVCFTHTLFSQRKLLVWYPILTGLGMSLNVLANLVLIPRYQSLGTALSALLTETVVAAASGLVLWRFFRRSRGG